MLALIEILAWLVCGVVAFGVAYAYRFWSATALDSMPIPERRMLLGISLAVIVSSGAVGLVVVLLLSAVDPSFRRT